METYQPKIVIAAMELVAETEALEMSQDEANKYVKLHLQERFPDIGELTVSVVTAEIMKTRVKGFW